MKIEIIDKGISEYEDVLLMQKKLHQRLLANISKDPSFGYIILTEHLPVITMGRHADENNILAGQSLLCQKNIKIHRIERGGDVTYHGPGQLVVYPILNLQTLNLGVKKYVKLIEESVIRTLQRFDISSGRKEGAPGIWIGNGETTNKICALGIKCSHFITMHGLALNVNTDLSGFDLINPCGFTQHGVTSMKKILGEEVDMFKLKEEFLHIFLSLVFSL